MARRSFNDILNSGKVDIAFEYRMMHRLFYQKQDRICDGYNGSLYGFINKNFVYMSIHGTCFTLDDFDDAYGFNFRYIAESGELEDLLLLMEYVLNFVVEIDSVPDWDYWLYEDAPSFIMDHAKTVCLKIGYKPIIVEDRIVIVEEDPLAIEAAQMLSEGNAYLPFQYHHSSFQGDIEGKKGIILSLAHELESRRNELEAIDRSLASDLFFLLNNLNIRHNNIEESSPKYKPYVASMSDTEIEAWYDKTFRMSLIALAQLNDRPTEPEMKTLKAELG